MKSKIKLSTFSIIWTALIFLVLYIGCILTVHNAPTFYSFLAVFIILAVLGFLYGVAYIKATPDRIIMGSLFKSRKILMRNVESVEMFQPTMGEIKIFASGGFMGYWGIFREGDIGRYFGFYGKSSDCFLIRMKNGDKYVLGCENPSAMVDYIKSQLK